jgi:hypothetical protein
MIEVAKHMILTNVFWLSLPFIGFVIIAVCDKYIRNKNVTVVTHFISTQHIFSRFIWSFAVSVFIFALGSLILFLLNAPAIILTSLYWLLLISSSIYALWRFSKIIFSVKSVDIFDLSGQPLLAKLLFFALCVVLLTDFAISLYVGSYAQVSADTYVHLSRIVSILSQGFTIQSGYFGGLGETGYHYNVVYALYAVGSQATGLQPYELWEYSFGFFRLIQWLAIFMLASYILRNWLKVERFALFGSMLACLVAVALFSNYFYTAVYPNQVVNVWIILILLSLSAYDYGVKQMAYVGLGLALIATMTHPTHAFMTAMFLGFIFVVRLLVSRKDLLENMKPTLVLYGSLMAILMLGPIRTFLFPNRMNSQQEDVGSFPTLDVFGLAMRKPVDVIPNTIGEVIIYSIGVIGSVYLLVRLWQFKRQFAIVASLLLFYSVIVYFPPVFTVMHAVLPMWVIDRFTAMNFIVYVQVFLGIYAVVVFFRYYISRQKNFPFKKVLVHERTTYLLAAAFVLFIVAWKAPSSYATLVANRVGNTHYYTFMDSTRAHFSSILNGEKTVVANQGDSYFLGSIMPIDVLAIEAGHMSPVASADNRIACQHELLKLFEYKDLKQVGASYVVLAKYEKLYNAQRIVADTKPYLQFIAEDANFYIYKVINDVKQTGGAAYKPCVDYKVIEAS